MFDLHKTIVALRQCNEVDQKKPDFVLVHTGELAWIALLESGGVAVQVGPAYSFYIDRLDDLMYTAVMTAYNTRQCYALKELEDA